MALKLATLGLHFHLTLRLKYFVAYQIAPVIYLWLKITSYSESTVEWELIEQDWRFFGSIKRLAL